MAIALTTMFGQTFASEMCRAMLSVRAQSGSLVSGSPVHWLAVIFPDCVASAFRRKAVGVVAILARLTPPSG